MLGKDHLCRFRNAVNKVSTIEDKYFSELELIADYRRLDKHDYFSKEGQYNNEFGFIIEGVMRIFYLSKNGEEHNKHFVLADDFVTASIHPDKKSITNIQALTTTTLASFNYSKFIALSDKFKQIGALSNN